MNALTDYISLSPAFLAEAPIRVPSSEPLELRVTEHFGDGCVVRTMHLGDKSIFFRVSADVLPPPLQTWDFAVIASIFTAMRLDRPLRVHGPVSASLLRNLEEFQEVWATWLPNHYKIIEIVANAEVEPRRETNARGVFAFSGGVDATFSLLRHVRGMAGRRGVTPAAAVLIKGFDLALGDERAFQIAHRNARDMLENLNVPFAVVETNWKADLCYTWEMEHVAGLAACLAQFAGLANVAVLGGDEGYDKIFIPWGSNLISNPLFSSNSMILRTEGSRFTRSERVAFVAKNSRLASQMRVCWKNARTGTNCGICEKCIRTQLNYRAVGLEPTGFLKTAGFWRIANIPIKSLGYDYYFGEIQRVATRNGVRGLWRIALLIGTGKYYALFPFNLAKEKLIFALRRNETLYRRAKDMVKRDA